MSSDSGDEGTSDNVLNQGPSGVSATGSDPSNELQSQIQQLTRLRDDLTRLNDETRAQRENSRAPTRSYIYVPRERQVQPFTGECGQDGRSVEEFIEEAERVLRSRGQTPEEQCDYILSLLRGPALEEVRLCMRGQSVGSSDVLSYLRNAFGERRSTTQLLQSFYNRKQADGEDLRDYSHALSQILSSVVKQSTNVIPDEKTILREQFIEGLRDANLRRELRKMVREKPASSLLEVRSEALLWEMEDNRSLRSKMVKNHQVQSETLGPQCSAIKTTNLDGHHAALDEVQRAVAHQGEQLVELTKTLAELSITVSEIYRNTHLTLQEPKPRVRPQPKFSPDGQPICFKCRGVGHIAKKCPQNKHSTHDTTPGSNAAQENLHPRLS